MPLYNVWMLPLLISCWIVIFLTSNCSSSSKGLVKRKNAPFQCMNVASLLYFVEEEKNSSNWSSSSKGLVGKDFGNTWANVLISSFLKGDSFLRSGISFLPKNNTHRFFLANTLQIHLQLVSFVVYKEFLFSQTQHRSFLQK